MLKLKSIFYNLFFHSKKKELIIIASGIESCAPIVIGASIDDTFKDKYKNIFTPAPIQIPNPINGIINISLMEFLIY